MRSYVLVLILNYHLNSTKSSGSNHFKPSFELSNLTSSVMDLQFSFQPHFNLILTYQKKQKMISQWPWPKCVFSKGLTRQTCYHLLNHPSSTINCQNPQQPTHKNNTIIISYLQLPNIQVSLPFTHINLPTFQTSQFSSIQNLKM